MANILTVGPNPPARKLAAKPSAAYPLAETPLSPAWTTTVMPESSTTRQNGSKTGSDGERRPTTVVGAAGRMTTSRAPADSAHSTSRAAQSTSASVTYGAAKMRPW